MIEATIRQLRRSFIAVSLGCGLTAGLVGTAGAQPLVPGTGVKVEAVGDDFEDESWSYRFQGLKSSEEMDGQLRAPTGTSANGRWYEGSKRGHPDVIRRTETPPGGLTGSKGSLLLQSLKTGIPGRYTRQQQQDDFICNVHYRMKGSISVSQSPNCVVRVFLPPVDQWENRSGTHFAFRVALDTTRTKPREGLFAVGSKTETETYWPGLFIEFVSKDGNPKVEDDYAYFRVRANRRGGDYRKMPITTTGWWTLGLSVTPDGQVHYFAKPGIEDLTAEDHIATEYPYGFRAEEFKTFFFNVCNGDDGRTWSTPWIIDDPEFYVLRRR